MPEEYLQVSFEIKAACDEISRRLLRWHWEQKPGSHTVESLLQHLEVRRKESPLYYDRLPDLERKTSWQQLDTTLCMRVLLDPEKDAAKPLDLLGNTAHPGAARRACNAVRTARNEAAHAADRTGGVQAALLFDEAIERLEEGYAGAAFSEKELEKYYKLAKEYMERCGAGHSAAGTRANPKPSPEPSQGREGAAGPARKAAEGNGTPKPIYTYGPIIHNEYVVNDLEKKGVRVLESEADLDALTEGTVIIRSHSIMGSPITYPYDYLLNDDAIENSRMNP